MLTVGLYRSTGIGSGTHGDPLRSKLSNYIDGTAGSSFEDWALDPSSVAARYALTVCDSTVHTAIAGDVDILPMSPQLDSLSALWAWLEGPIGAVAVPLRNAIEADGVPIDDFTVATPRRAVIRRIAMRHRIGQYMAGTLDSNALAFLIVNLSTLVSAVPAGPRNRAQAWMVERGLDTSWIIGATIVREVLRYIYLNLNLSTLRWARMGL